MGLISHLRLVFKSLVTIAQGVARRNAGSGHRQGGLVTGLLLAVVGLVVLAGHRGVRRW